MDWPARWHRLWHSLGGSQPDDRLLAELLARYAEPPRAYHTLQHLAECLSHFDGVCALAQRPSEVEVTLWFHDAIYETQPRDPGHDNEEASAQWAQQALLARGIAPERAQRVAALIRLTKHGADAVTGDGALLLDIDLAILGSALARYDEYETQIRQEYQWVPWPQFCTARTQILRGFLARPTIYRTDRFRQQYESTARNNLQRAITRLDDGLGLKPA